MLESADILILSGFFAVSFVAFNRNSVVLFGQILFGLRIEGFRILIAFKPYIAVDQAMPTIKPINA
ncbi:hypothetical protein SD71_19770 [Cohnella kolymensis]|uniref:Uncharacterized protein n=1 Tax=Cohnella kolymensis TaxID=1590652 RepID=A0ABR4ZZX5_9BACL|nr:hypothetical protein SD71_19770 [Cohnella kolymensis]